VKYPVVFKQTYFTGNYLGCSIFLFNKSQTPIDNDVCWTFLIRFVTMFSFQVEIHHILLEEALYNL
jgi:hypothetical protein